MNISNNGYTDDEKQRILEALNFLKLNLSKAIEMRTVHATAMLKARKLVEIRRSVK